MYSGGPGPELNDHLRPLGWMPDWRGRLKREAKRDLDESRRLYREEHIRRDEMDKKKRDISGFCITMGLEAAADPTLRVAHHS